MTGSDRSLRVLLICTRDPRGRMSGRKMVLQTILRSLTELGHLVTVGHFGPSAGRGAAELPATYLRLPMPRPWELAAASAGALVLRRRSVNEALYASRRAHAAIADLVAGNGYDLVITDMIRTAPYGERSGLPWIADLDDLLSARYAHMADAAAGAGLLGYHRAPLIGWLLRHASAIQPALLRREAAVLAQREAAVVRRADLVSLVSGVEARRLTEAVGIRVVSTPMAVPGPAEVAPLDGRPFEAVFLGGLDYGPNLTALSRFDRDLIPALAARGVGGFDLHVIGYSTTSHRANFSPRIHFRGYCPDVQAELQRYRLMLVPEVTPGGVKTKIIEATLTGTLVLAHVTALDGMAFRPGIEVLAWRDAEGLAAQVARLRGAQIDSAAMARAARARALEHYSPEVLKARWQGNLAACLAIAQGRPVRRPIAPRRAGLEEAIE